MNRRALVLAAGTGLAGVVILALAAPDLLRLDVGRIAVVLVAVLALVQALHLANVRRHTEFARERTPDPERRHPAGPPGEELQDAFRQFRQEPHAFYRMSGRRGLRVAAVAALTRYGSVSREEARERVENGTWTDDEVAAEFLQGGTWSSLSRRLGRWLGGDSADRDGIERCVEAIAAVADVSPAGEQAGGDRPPSGRRTDRGARTDVPEGRLARRETDRWRGISVVVLAAVGVGVALEEPAVLLVGVVGLAYGAYARAHELAPRLSVERSLADEEPAPGDEVEVKLRLTNEGDQVLPDVRVVDGVPGGLAVSDGSPRRGTALRPGESVEWSYAVTARRGVHEFDPALVLVRNAPGAVELVHGVAPDRSTRLTCTPPLRELPAAVPLRGANSRHVGRQPTAASGDGTEFHATRPYRHGDDVGRIDWNRRARTGELATVLFRRERAATVVLLVDTGPASYVAPEPGDEHAVDRAVEAAGRAYASLANRGHFVGIGSLVDPDCWLDPGSGPTHRARARELLTTHPELHPTPRVEDRRVSALRARRAVRRRLPAGSQVVVFSPLCRRTTVGFLRQLEASDHAVTVVSPDATASATPGQQLARVGRRVHLTDLRGDGIPVLDWAWDEPLVTALARFESRVATR